MKKETAGPMDYYAAIGRCMNMWSMADGVVFRLFCHCLEADDQKCSVLYYRTSGLSTRIQMTSDLAKIALNQNDRDAWTGIQQALMSLISTRNLMAHNPIHRASDYVVTWSATDRHDGYELTPPSFDLRRSSGEMKNPKRKTDRHDINMLIEHFNALAVQVGLLSGFVRRLRDGDQTRRQTRRR